MEDYEYKVINLHATYSKIISKSTSNISKNTRESGSRRFYLGNSSSFGGCFEIFLRLSSGIRAVDALTSLGRSPPIAATPLPAALPIFTELYRRLPIFRTFLGDFSHQKRPLTRLSVLLFQCYSTVLFLLHRSFGLSCENRVLSADLRSR